MKKAFVFVLVLMFLVLAGCNNSDLISTASKGSDSLPQWKKLYLDTLEDIKDDYREFALIYIDSDNIPELYVSGKDEATGDKILAVKNNALLTQYLLRIGGSYYIPKSGLILNQNGHMGAYHTDIYRLEAEFEQLFSGLRTESIKGSETNYELIEKYYTNIKIANNDYEGDEVTEAEFNEEIGNLFDLSKKVSMNETTYSYDEILNKIVNY